MSAAALRRAGKRRVLGARSLTFVCVDGRRVRIPLTSRLWDLLAVGISVRLVDDTRGEG